MCAVQGTRSGLLPLPIKEVEGRKGRSLEVSGSPTEQSYDAREMESPRGVLGFINKRNYEQAQGQFIN